jgi:hypothetical protein
MVKDIDKWMREQENTERMERYKKKITPKKTLGQRLNGLGTGFDNTMTSISRGAVSVQKGYGKMSKTLAPFQPNVSSNFGFGGMGMFGGSSPRRARRRTHRKPAKSSRMRPRRVVTYY